MSGRLIEYDVLYNRDISRRTDIAIIRREPGEPWEVHYYMHGYGDGLTQADDEPGEVFEERKEAHLEKRIKDAYARVQLHRWTARKEWLADLDPDYERVTRGPTDIDHTHSLDCATHDHRPGPCNCDLADAAEDACCGHTSDCAVHNEPAYPAGPCNCDMRGDHAPKPINEDYAPTRMTGPARAVADPYPDHPTRADDHAERVLPHSEPWFRPTPIKKGGPRS